MNRDARNIILILGLLLTLFATFCLWFLQYQYPGYSPSRIPDDYWGEVNRVADHARGLIGVPLIAGHFAWLLFAWRLVRRLNQVEARAEADQGDSNSSD